MVRILFLSASLLCLPSMASAESPLRVLEQPIKGGDEVTQGEFTGVVGVRSIASMGGAGVLCTGSLIAPNLVLTARHCVAQAPTGSINCGSAMFGDLFTLESMVVVANTNLREPERDQVFEVEEMYVPESKRVCGDDIALIKLKSTVPSSTSAPYVPRVDVPAMAQEGYTSVGFGGTSQAGDGLGTMRVLKDRVVDCRGDACGRGRVRDTEFFGDDGLCGGDSGGPALDAQGRIIGVASRIDRPDCRDTTFSEVHAHADWVLGVARSAVPTELQPGWVLTGVTQGAGADDDGDGVPNGQDVCPGVEDPGQEDLDQDGEGDACDSDIDGDAVLNASDNCPQVANDEQVDADMDGLGDACDPDTPGVVVMEPGPPDMGSGPPVYDMSDPQLPTPSPMTSDEEGCSVTRGVRPAKLPGPLGALALLVMCVRCARRRVE